MWIKTNFLTLESTPLIKTQIVIGCSYYKKGGFDATMKSISKWTYFIILELIIYCLRQPFVEDFSQSTTLMPIPEKHSTITYFITTCQYLLEISSIKTSLFIRNNFLSFVLLIDLFFN